MDDNSLETSNPFYDKEFENSMAIKTRRHKTAFIIKLVLFLVILLGIGAYPLFGASQIRGLELHGNYLLNKSDVLQLSNVNTKTPVLFMNEKKMIDNLEESPFIESASITWRPTHMILTIDEVAAMINYNEDTYLSNGLTIAELSLTHPDCENIFERANVPTFLSTLFFHFTKERKSLFLNNLKVIDRNILNSFKYIDYRGNGTSFVITDGYVLFYKESDDGIYNRIACKEENLGFFLQEDKINQMLQRLEEEPNAKVTTDAIDPSIKYRSITCYYGNKEINGTMYQNPCIVDTI